MAESKVAECPDLESGYIEATGKSKPKANYKIKSSLRKTNAERLLRSKKHLCQFV